MTGYNSFDFNNSAFFKAIEQFQRTIDAIKVPMDGITAAVQAYHDAVAPMTATLQNINNLYAPILEQTRKYEELYNNSMIAALQSSASAMKAMAGLDLSAIQSIADALPKYDFLSDSILKHIDFDAVAEMYDEGTITDEDIAEEFQKIVTKKEFSFVETWDNAKKSKWFLAIRWLLIILMFFGSPVVDKVKENTLEVLGVNDFWEESGVYEWLDDLFGIENGTVTEEEAKETVDESKTGNISKQKRDDILGKIKEIRTFISAAPQDENTGNLLSYLSDIEKDVNGKKYGLIFEEHCEKIDEVLYNYTPVLNEYGDLFIDNGGEMNFLVEGDNLASLQLLKKTHKGRIDVIYIDPPYNTLKEGFTYSDTLIDKNDTFRHSKWLSFMQQRLLIAKELLSDNGVIFVSLDDNEIAALRVLCDEIFGYQNFVANIIWEKKFSPQNDAKWLSDSHDHILLYAKNKEQWHPNLLSRTEEMDKRYSNPDNDPRGPWASSDFTVKTASDSYMYPIETPSGRIVMPTASRSWVTSEENYKALKADNRIWFGSKGNNVPRIKTFLSEVQQGTVCKTIWYRTEVGDTQEGTRDLKNVFGKAGAFTNPKPVRLIERVLEIASKDDSIILDFFAGSGTTGHAVLKYNANNKGSNRRFILCTNNENNICRDVTYERIKRVISKEEYPASLKYYKVEYVPISARMYYEYADDLLAHIRELVELENGINFVGNAEIGIVLTEEELADFIDSVDDFEKCRKLYMGHDLLPSDKQEQILKARGIEISIIPDYYYKDLQEG